jgi:hypothetical protein
MIIGVEMFYELLENERLKVRNIRKLKKNQNELEEMVLEFINQKLKVNMDIRDIDVLYRLGKETDDKKNRYLIHKLMSEKKKMK